MCHYSSKHLGNIAEYVPALRGGEYGPSDYIIRTELSSRILSRFMHRQQVHYHNARSEVAQTSPNPTKHGIPKPTPIGVSGMKVIGMLEVIALPRTLHRYANSAALGTQMI